MVILGIWDGHDSGAALLVGGRVVAAVNEERLSRRKLEIRFPELSIRECLRVAGIKPEAVEVVACSTWDIAKTLARWFPSTKERYYMIRRRKTFPGRLSAFQKRFKYWLTERPGNRISRGLSTAYLRRELGRLGLGRARVALYDHHYCHAVAAACTSGLGDCTVLTVDGVGDGLSSTVSEYRGGRLERIGVSSAENSLGILFEHVTNLLNMRELEDEGKVMALADFAAPIPDERNEVMGFVEVVGLETRLRVPGRRLHHELKRVQWKYPNEQMAYQAQRTVDAAVARLVANAVRQTGLPRVALAGGVASNIKANRTVRLLPEVEDVYVFPHMGDGGLAMGAALAAGLEHGECKDGELNSLALGPEFQREEIEAALLEAGAAGVAVNDLPAAVADLLAMDEVVLWFQGRLEYGPRALGQRSILARPDRPALKDRLNLILKQRVWYQPFCPTLLESDARAAFSDWKGRPSRHMTMGYMVAPECREKLAGVIGIDGSCRPQIVADDSDGPYARVLHAVRARIGIGAILNTSFNIHGEPIVCSPREAVDVFQRSGADSMAIGPFLVRRAG